MTELKRFAPVLDWNIVSGQKKFYASMIEVANAPRLYVLAADYEAAIEAENRRWQDAIYEACKAVAVECGKPTHAIDGGGSDSGDGLDFTLEEIAQAFDILRESKCADYERLRDAMEKISQEWQALNEALIKYYALTVPATIFAGQEIRDMRDAVRRGREALTPAAPCATTSSELVAARKSEESSSGGRK